MGPLILVMRLKLYVSTFEEIFVKILLLSFKDMADTKTTEGVEMFVELWVEEVQSFEMQHRVKTAQFLIITDTVFFICNKIVLWDIRKW